MPANSTPSHLYFLTQRKGNGAVLFSMQGTPRGPELSKIGTFDNRDEPQVLAAALNGALQGGTAALTKVHQCSTSLPGPLKKAITDLVEEIEDAHRVASRARAARKTARSLTENLEQPNTAVFSLFSTTACGGCPDCGCVVDEDCANCAVCGPAGRDCENCGTVEVTPRTAFSLHHELRDLADRTYVTVQSGFWECGVPDSVETQTDWFLLRCARAYDDLAADLLAGDVPAARCLAESVALGYAMSGLPNSSAELVSEHDAYEALPSSRFDNDWDFLASGLFAAGAKAKAFLTSAVIEEDLSEDWFRHYPGVEPRDRSRGFRG
ncbi:hypothetical protein ACFY74_06180 [Streptomyces massasporeus]|uniref:hypothetical protein n=1 Tax=Streptomyces massasporeus TaxID=67324 RepID=UPI0036D111B1